MALFNSVWVVEDDKDGKLIGIFSTKDMAEDVVKETVDRSTVLREMLVDNRAGGPQLVDMSGTTIGMVSIHGKTGPFWTDPETGKLHVDPIWADIVNAKRAEQLSTDRSRKSWWRFWE